MADRFAIHPSEDVDGGLVSYGSRYERAELPDGTTDVVTMNYPGMSLRDWFAGQAIAGVAHIADSPQNRAQFCYEIADAMLKQRKETAR